MGHHFFEGDNFSIRVTKNEISIHTKVIEGWIYQVGFDREALEEVLELLIRSRTYWDKAHSEKLPREAELSERHHMHDIGQEKIAYPDDACPVCTES